MVTAATHPPDQVPSLDINLRGRTFPVSYRTASATHPRVVHAAEPPSNSDRFRRRLLEMLSFPWRSSDEFSGSVEIVRSFGTDMVLLETLSQQWRRFLANLKRANLQSTFASGVTKKQQVQAIDKALALMGYESEVMVDDNGVLNSDLIERPPAVVHETLQTVVHKVVDRFVSVMQRDLEQLSEMRVVGLLEWTGEATCSFHFYEHDLTVTVEHKRTEERAFPVHRADRPVRMGVEITEKLAGRHIHRVTRHEELLMEAAAKAAGDPDLILPARVRQIVRQCPAWLRPELGVVEGEKCREEWVELVRMESDWEVQWSRRRIMPHFDPALTLFDEFVLTGWDDEAHENEIRQRLCDSSQRLEDTQNKSPRAAPDTDLQWMITWGIVSIIAMAGGVGLGSPVNGLSMLLTVLSIPPARRFLQRHRIRGIALESKHRIYLIGAWIFALGVLGTGLGMVLFATARILPSFVLLAAASTGYAVAFRVQFARIQNPSTTGAGR